MAPEVPGRNPAQIHVNGLSDGQFERLQEEIKRDIISTKHDRALERAAARRAAREQSASETRGRE